MLLTLAADILFRDIGRLHNRTKNFLVTSIELVNSFVLKLGRNSKINWRFFAFSHRFSLNFWVFLSHTLFWDALSVWQLIFVLKLFVDAPRKILMIITMELIGEYWTFFIILFERLFETFQKTTAFSDPEYFSCFGETRWLIKERVLAPCRPKLLTRQDSVLQR